MALTVEDLDQAIQKLDPEAVFRPYLDPEHPEIRGVVVSNLYRDDPGVLRSQKLWLELRRKLGRELSGSGPFVVYSHEEWKELSQSPSR
jgi:hypothetical protein